MTDCGELLDNQNLPDPVHFFQVGDKTSKTWSA